MEFRFFQMVFRCGECHGSKKNYVNINLNNLEMVLPFQFVKTHEETKLNRFYE
jgi:hypothetical protein